MLNAPKPFQPTADQPRFTQQVRASLADGFGVEDIAAAFGAPLITVRFVAELFEQSGALRQTLSRRSDA